MRRNDVWMICALLTTLLGMQSASALDRGRELLISNDAEQARLMSTVENALWAVDGNKADKAVYVVYSTECAWSKRLFDETRRLTDKVQLRWIPAGVIAAPDVVAARNTDAVANAFLGKRAALDDPAMAQRGVDYNHGVMDSISYQLRPHAASKTFAFPTLVYQTPQGVKVVAGIPKSLDKLVSEVTSQPEKAQLHPASIEMTAEPVKVTTSPHLKMYSHNNAQPVELFLAPSQQAAPVDTLAKGFELTVTGVVADSGWIETAPWGTDGPKAYVHEPVLARLAGMDFRVTPQGGVVSAESQLEIKRFPDPESPVLLTLDAGYQINRSGLVELKGQTWDQVVVLSDGTKGYILR